MRTQLDARDIALLLESLEYTKLSVGTEQGAPPEVRRDKLGHIDLVMQKLRQIRDGV